MATEVQTSVELGRVADLATPSTKLVVEILGTPAFISTLNFNPVANTLTIVLGQVQAEAHEAGAVGDCEACAPV